jgi:nitroreductase
MPISPSELLDTLNFRYATKAFDPSRQIPAESWKALESSLVLTPSSFGLQPWKFIVVESPDLREKLKAASWGQGQVTDASHLVVFTARTDLSQQDIESWMKRLSEIQGAPMEKLAGFADVISSFSSSMNQPQKHAWNTRQVYIALGQLMTAAAFMEIDTCPLEGISPSDYDEVLGLKESGYSTAVACALGYRSEDDSSAKAKKARFPENQIISRI